MLETGFFPFFVPYFLTFICIHTPSNINVAYYNDLYKFNCKYNAVNNKSKNWHNTNQHMQFFSYSLLYINSDYLVDIVDKC